MGLFFGNVLAVGGKKNAMRMESQDQPRCLQILPSPSKAYPKSIHQGVSRLYRGWFHCPSVALPPIHTGLGASKPWGRRWRRAVYPPQVSLFLLPSLASLFSFRTKAWEEGGGQRSAENRKRPGDGGVREKMATDIMCGFWIMPLRKCQV